MMDKKLMRKWHNESLFITRHGLRQMRSLIIVGFSLGLILGILIGKL